MASRVLTVMFTDIKGFTERTMKSTRDELGSILDEHEDLLPPILKKFGGHVVKTVGDAFMVTFESPTNAVLCGIMIQDRLFERNRDVPDDERLEVRVAVNSGEVVEREGDIFGEAVNIASRIEGITEASEIYFTESVYLAMNKAEVPSSEIGLRRLKGLPEAIKVYRVIQDRHSAQYQQLLERLRTEKFHDVAIPTTGQRGLTRFLVRPHSARGYVLAAVAIVVVCAVAVGIVFALRRPEVPPAAAAAVVALPAAVAAPSGEDAERATVVKDYAGVRESIAQGELGLALARADAMLKDHPTHKESHEAVREVVAAEVKVLVDAQKLEKAWELLEERKKNNREYISFDATERDLLLRLGAAYSRRKQYGLTENVYHRLLDRWPDDPEILRRAVEDAGAGSPLEYTPTGCRAARAIAESTTGALDERVARTLLDDLEREYATDEDAVAIRAILAERHAGTEAVLRGWLAGERETARLNAYVFLKERGKLSDDEELAHHLHNLFEMSPTDSRERPWLEAAIAYVEAAGARDDWPARKAAAGVAKIETVKGLFSAHELAEKLMTLLIEAFAPEIRDTVLAWTKGDEPALRVRGYEMLAGLGLDKDFDHWAYHAWFVALDDYSYQYPFFHRAVAFFVSQALTARAAEAKKVLEGARAKMASWWDDLGDTGRKQFRRNYEVNLKAVDDALATF